MASNLLNKIENNNPFSPSAVRLDIPSGASGNNAESTPPGTNSSQTRPRRCASGGSPNTCSPFDDHADDGPVYASGAGGLDERVGTVAGDWRPLKPTGVGLTQNEIQTPARHSPSEFLSPRTCAVSFCIWKAWAHTAPTESQTLAPRTGRTMRG